MLHSLQLILTSHQRQESVHTSLFFRFLTLGPVVLMRSVGKAMGRWTSFFLPPPPLLANCKIVTFGDMLIMCFQGGKVRVQEVKGVDMTTENEAVRGKTG